jgi:hypothetical protein
MSSSQELYRRIIGTLHPLVPFTNRKQLSNWVWIIVGILQGQSVHLSEIVTYIPVGSPKAEARLTTVRRWLSNPKIEVWAFYRPLLEQVLADWRSVEAIVILDGLQVFGDRWQIFRLSLRHGNRAIPLAWTVMPGRGFAKVAKLEAMLRQVAECLDGRVTGIRLLADAGFRDCGWAELCEKFGWHYNIRLPVNTYVWQTAERRCRIDQLDVPRGQRRYFQSVTFTAKAKGLGNLSITWSPGDATHQPELIAIRSDQPSCRQRLTEYSWRMDIEESFRDDQSGGFDLAHTRLQHAERLEHLLLAVAIATLWCHELGEQVLQGGDVCRREIDPGFQRELSLFQLGLRWLKRCLATAWQRLAPFRALLKPIKLAPVVRRANC